MREIPAAATGTLSSTYDLNGREVERQDALGARWTTQHPHHGLNRMNAGIHVVTAADRRIVHPDQRAESALDILRQRRVAEQPSVVKALDQSQGAQSARAVALRTLDHVRIGRHLVIHQKAPLLLGGLLRCGIDLQTPRDIHSHRLGHEDVDSCIHGRLDMLGKETRRGFQRHRFHAAVDQPAVSRQPAETPRTVDAQRVACGVRHGLEVIGHGVHFVAAVFAKQVGDPRPASATADDTQLDLARGLG
jgi:hypothetical protein